ACVPTSATAAGAGAGAGAGAAGAAAAGAAAGALVTGAAGGLLEHARTTATSRSLAFMAGASYDTDVRTGRPSADHAGRPPGASRDPSGRVICRFPTGKPWHSGCSAAGHARSQLDCACVHSGL